MKLVLNLYELNKHKMLWFHNVFKFRKGFKFWFSTNTVTCRKSYEAFQNTSVIIITNNLWIIKSCDSKSVYFLSATPQDWIYAILAPTRDLCWRLACSMYKLKHHLRSHFGRCVFWCEQFKNLFNLFFLHDCDSGTSCALCIAPHLTALWVLKGQCYFSTTVLESRAAHGCRAEPWKQPQLNLVKQSLSLSSPSSRTQESIRRYGHPPCNSVEFWHSFVAHVALSSSLKPLRWLWRWGNVHELHAEHCTKHTWNCHLLLPRSEAAHRFLRGSPWPSCNYCLTSSHSFMLAHRLLTSTVPPFPKPL